MVPRFSLARPSSLSEAFAAYATAPDDAAYLAGGTELLQVMKMGFAQFAVLVDLKRIEDLRGITLDDGPDGRLRIGAGTTHRDVERSEAVRRALPALAALAARIANVRVRNTGTIGGNLAFAEPHSDPATFLLACGASVELAGPAGRRELPIGEFILGPLFTALEPGEVIVAIHVPPAAAGTGRAYEKIAFFERPAASVAVALTITDGVVGRSTVAVGSLTEVPTIVDRAAAALDGIEASAEAVGAALDAAGGLFDDLDVGADLNGSADYKRHLAGVLLGRAARGALLEAGTDD